MMIDPVRLRIGAGRQLLLALAVSLAAVTGILAMTGQVAFGHADIVRADPPPDAVLPDGPERVTVWFTEPLAAGFSEIRVFDSAGKRADNSDSTVDLSSPAMMSVSLGAVPRGVYTVAWRSFSNLDGHSAEGSFIFWVGEPEEPLRASSPAPTPSPPLLQSPLEPLLHWFTLIAALALAGGLVFSLLVADPSLARYPVLARELRGRTYRLMAIAVIVLLLSETGRLLNHVAGMPELFGVRMSGGVMARILTETDWGQIWVWRIILVALIGWTLALLVRERGEGRYGRWVALVAVLGMLLTLSLTSHDAAVAGLRFAGACNDYLHLLAAGFWAGGVFHFAAGAPLIFRLESSQRQFVLAALVPRFSMVALPSVATLVVTGLYSSWALIGSPSALFGTAYGLILVVKLVVMLPLIALGALNLLYVGPALAKTPAAANHLRKFVTIEAGILLLLLMVVGALTGVQPARQAAARMGIGIPGIELSSGAAADLTVNLRVEPGQVGANRLVVRLDDRRGRQSSPAEVSLMVRYLGSGPGETEAAASRQPDGTYVSRQFIGIAGPWQAEVTVRRTGSFDARTTFKFDIPVTVSSADPAAPSPATGRVLFGVELGILTLVYAVTALAAVRSRTRS